MWFHCERCSNRATLPDAARFCPRCGQPIAPQASNVEPIEVTDGRNRFVVRHRLSAGSVSNLYHCSPISAGRNLVFKVARDVRANVYLRREFGTLQSLHRAAHAREFAPFLPFPITQLDYSDGTDTRVANILDYHAEIGSPLELYSLAEVGSAYADGIDARDMAWMWRRTLTILQFVHANQIVHGAVTADHLLIEPKEHKLVLVGWANALKEGESVSLGPSSLGGRVSPEPAARARDLSLAAEAMSRLLKKASDPGIVRHLDRAISSPTTATQLLYDFDRLIDVLWGPRQFRPFRMPAR